MEFKQVVIKMSPPSPLPFAQSDTPPNFEIRWVVVVCGETAVEGRRRCQSAVQSYSKSKSTLWLQLQATFALSCFVEKPWGGRSTGGNGECGRQQMLQNCVQIVAVVSHNFPGLHDWHLLGICDSFNGACSLICLLSRNGRPTLHHLATS